MVACFADVRFSAALVVDRHINGKGLQTLCVGPAVKDYLGDRGEKKYRGGENQHAD